MIRTLRADGDEARAASVEVHDADPHVLTILDRGRTLGDPGRGGRSTTPVASRRFAFAAAAAGGCEGRASLAWSARYWDRGWLHDAFWAHLSARLRGEQ